MNYEEFNDAMCRLRQAEEDLNRALRDIYVAINRAESKPIYGEMLKDTEVRS